jgi:hypothetical protein
MGVPTSSLLSEIVLQHMEHNAIYNILTLNNILGYFTYVDDILIVYSKSHTNIHKVHKEFNNINNDIQFTIEEGIDNSINFLDITIKKTDNTIITDIYTGNPPPPIPLFAKIHVIHVNTNMLPFDT